MYKNRPEASQQILGYTQFFYNLSLCGVKNEPPSLILCDVQFISRKMNDKKSKKLFYQLCNVVKRKAGNTITYCATRRLCRKK